MISKLNSYSLKEITDEKDKGWQYLIKIEKTGGEITLISFMDNKVDARTIASMLMSDVNLKSYSDTSYHNEELKSLTRYRFDKVKERALSLIHISSDLS